MVRIIMDVYTRGLREASQNLDPKFITRIVDIKIRNWYKRTYKPRVLRIIASGSPRNMIPRNVGRYRDYKLAKYGIDHGLGRLTHKLYEGVKDAPIRTAITRGKEVRLVIDYRSPHYIAYVHDGTKTTLRRPFVEVARDQTLGKLMDQLDSMLDGLDFTHPELDLISSVIATTR